MYVSRGNTGWNTRVRSSGKEKDQRYVWVVFFFIALLITRESIKDVGYYFE